MPARKKKATGDKPPSSAMRKRNNNSSFFSPLRSATTSPLTSPLAAAAATSSPRKYMATVGMESTSPSPLPRGSVPTLADLRTAAASGMESLKRHIESCHSDALKDLEASRSRISKRYKIQSQACLQLSENIEKDCKKLSDRIKESAAIMKKSYAEAIAEAQSSGSRVGKAIPELMKSMEDAIQAMRTRYNASSE